MKSLQVLTAMAVAMLVLVGLTAPTWAGGWATISLDAWPKAPTARQPFQVGFILRQHGNDDSRMNGLSAQVHFEHLESGERLSAPAVGDGQDGHYVAEINLPAAGAWAWSIEAFTVKQPMPALTVLAEAAHTAPATAPGVPLAGLAAAGLGLLLAAVLAGRQRYRLASLAGALGVCLGVFVLSAVPGRLHAATTAARAAAPLPVNPAELGENLFVAKGCITCHANNRIDENLVVFSTEVGPNLSSYRAAPEFLQLWLEDPRSIKPDTQMPNLGLTSAEIDALIAFLASQ